MSKNVNSNLLFKKAEESIEVARRALKKKDEASWVVCYHCQQAVEQFLRMFLASHSVSVTDISLVSLNKDCSVIADGFKAFDSDCSFLSFGGLDIRYPTNITLTKNDAHRAIKAAEEIKNFVREKLR